MSYPSFKSSVRRPSVSGFTLVELLTVVAIIGILAAILLPVVGKIRATVQNTKCQTNLRQWGQATLLFANDNKGSYSLRGGANNTYWTALHTNVNDMLYGPYFASSGAINSARYCPVYALPESGNNPINYMMNRPYLDAKKNVAAANAISFRAIARPAQMLLMSEIDVWSGTGNPWMIGKAGLQEQINPLFAADKQRHGLNANAVFADGHVIAITAADIEQNGDLWTRLDGVK